MVEAAKRAQARIRGEQNQHLTKRQIEEEKQRMLVIQEKLAAQHEAQIQARQDQFREQIRAQLIEERKKEAVIKLREQRKRATLAVGSLHDFPVSFEFNLLSENESPLLM